MFSIGDGTKFWLYTKPTDMRKNFNMLPLGLLVGATLLGVVVSVASRASAATRARNRRQHAVDLMHERVAAVGRSAVLGPVERELARYAGFCVELDNVRGRH